MRVDEFDFELPENLIALHPAVPRDSARMLCVGADGSLSDKYVADLVGVLRYGDILVVNDTRVIPAELSGIRHRDTYQANVSFNLHKRIDAQTWAAFARPAKRLKAGDRIVFGEPNDRACASKNLTAVVCNVLEGGQILLTFDLSGAFLDEAIKSHGAMPLPPYIGSKRAIEPSDEQDYQTMFAKFDGAVAAPTAGLHFTPALLEKLEQNGVAIERVTLHVGAGTFLPVKVEDTKDHKMHSEWGEISEASVERINKAQRQGGRVVAVGTTSLRILESACRESGALAPFSGDTDIFITPGYKFGVVDMLMTNFHLPRSTLFMLVSAFCGAKTMKQAYAHAIADQYRFYSYGDASLLARSPES
ncbi:MAG: tRNA preQ1(34) S-adenosylmethionine ribosyltransferase-isomerase QueA [Devosiaceae bacterium]|nr:tRNA preQ1(34) S-adenosylmethionine ribosyltransferase-isomerase QueA [Devosiaceae bacterium]